MKNLELNRMNCVEELTQEEAMQITGGTGTGFWQDVAFLVGATAHGLVVFGREGGRNAGLCVR